MLISTTEGTREVASPFSEGGLAVTEDFNGNGYVITHIASGRALGSYRHVTIYPTAPMFGLRPNYFASKAKAISALKGILPLTDWTRDFATLKEKVDLAALEQALLTIFFTIKGDKDYLAWTQEGRTGILGTAPNCIGAPAHWFR